MKTIMNKLMVLLFLFFCNCSDVENMAELSDTCFPNVDDRYEYPVIPGTEEWSQLSSTDEAFQVCQLPDNVLKSISTTGLIDALVHSPLFTGYYLLSSSPPIETWYRHYSRFNSTQELFNRENLGEALVSYYKAIDLDCIESTDRDEDYSLTGEYERLMGLEFLFTNQEILVKTGHQKKQELVEAFLTKHEQNKEHWTVIVPIAWVMLDDNYTPMVEYYENNTGLYEQSILLGYVFSTEQSDLIISIANSYINKK